MNMRATIGELAVLFILLALGYFGCKLKALTPDTGKVLTKLVFNITLPATILNAVLGSGFGIGGGDTVIFMLFVLLAFLVYMAIALLSARILIKEKKQRGLYAFMIAFGNISFMGLPVAQAILGAEAIIYVALFNIPFWIASFSIGVILVSGKKEKFDPKALINPVLIVSAIAIPFSLLNFHLPAVITQSLSLAGRITTPASMLIIGIILAQTPLKDVFTDIKLYPAALVKLVVVPLVVWLIFRTFVTDELILAVLVVLSAMPTAAKTAMFALEYSNNEATASGGVFISTLLSGITIPIIVYFLL